ncbi:MAG: alpha/beta fold hydrolase, partial [Acidobacteriota bacterium]|nr:alpha/beta fold hydrolase [Acidobacteriota bacterium]
MLRTLLLILISLAVVVPIWLVLADVDVAGLESRPDPVGSYSAARAYIEGVESEETDDLRSECRTVFLDHGRKTGKAVVYFHGLTSCPEQFRALGEQIYDRGYNVWIVRLPHHGLEDPLNTEQADLDAEELTALTDRVIDVGTALGDTLIVVGLSTGGVMAAWAAQYRSDVDRTVIIAPCFAIQPFNKDTTPWLASTALSIP